MWGIEVRKGRKKSRLGSVTRSGHGESRKGRSLFLGKFAIAKAGKCGSQWTDQPIAWTAAWLVCHVHYRRGARPGGAGGAG